jgi:nucleotide-binding universal stress UspA family protein
LRFKKILAPIDFSPASRNGLNHALRFAEEFGAELTLLYVLEPPASASFVAIPGAVAFSETDFAKAEKNLRSLVASVRPQDEEPRWNVRTGVPSHEIVEAAREADIDLIVIATHGYTGWKHFCIGSTAERVVRAAPCPVLVVREKEQELS